MKVEHSIKKRRAIRAAQVTGQVVGRQKEAPTEAMVEEDPLGCAQLLVCQLAATPSHLLQPHQRAVLDFARLVPLIQLTVKLDMRSCPLSSYVTRLSAI